jgi:hypothetical protein
VFTSPLHEAEYQLFVEHGYLDFLLKLADITDYYNFAGINDIAINNANFDDVFHHNIKTGDLVLDTIVNGITDPRLLSQGFGVLVTKENAAINFTRRHFLAHISRRDAEKKNLISSLRVPASLRKVRG